MATLAMEQRGSNRPVHAGSFLVLMLLALVVLAVDAVLSTDVLFEWDGEAVANISGLAAWLFSLPAWLLGLAARGHAGTQGDRRMIRWSIQLGGTVFVLGCVLAFVGFLMLLIFAATGGIL